MTQSRIPHWPCARNVVQLKVSKTNIHLCIPVLKMHKMYVSSKKGPDSAGC